MPQTNVRENDKHYVELFLPFIVLLSPYKIGPVSTDTIGLIIITLLLAVKHHGKIKISSEFKPFLAFLAYVVLRDMVRMVLGTDSFQTQANRMIEYVINFFLMIAVCSEGFDDEKLYKVWKIAGIIYTIGLAYHLVQIYILGLRVVPISLVPGYSIRATDNITYNRPSSFFPEPASFVNAMIPLEFLALRKRDIKIAIFTTVAILASTSTVGVILSIILWSASFFQRDLKTRTKFIMIVATIGIVYAFANFDLFGASFTKLLLAAEGGSTFGSRVRGSLEIVSAESWLEKIVGTNYNEVNGFIATHASMFSTKSTVQIYWRGGSGSVFLNTFGQLFFKYGLIGFILFMVPLIRYLRKNTYQAKPYIIMIIAAVFGQTMLLNSYFFMTMMLIVLFSKAVDNQTDTECISIT
jgi:hypothetical protein